MPPVPKQHKRYIMADNQGVELDFHAAECALWYDEECDCFVKRLDNYMLVAEFDERDALSGKVDTSEYEYWEEANPPRRSKTERPKHTEDGRSVKLLSKLIGRRGKKK